MKILFPIALLMASCTNNDTLNNSTPSIKDSLVNNTIDSNTVEPIRVTENINYSDSLNSVDSNNWKQGKHILRNQWGKIIEEATYKNDTIVGYFEYWDGMQKDGFYLNGKKQGNWNWYYDSGSILLITHYEKDSVIWHVPYSANKELLIPIKDFSPVADSFYMEVPHPNGRLWYEGTFINKEATGTHKVYDETGILRGIVEYDNEMFSKYDSTGKFIKKDSIQKYLYMNEK